MNYRWHEIRELAELLEAEASGSMVDHRRVHHLASCLAEHHPEIGRSMRMICERMQVPGAARG